MRTTFIFQWEKAQKQFPFFALAIVNAMQKDLLSPQAGDTFFHQICLNNFS